MPTEAYNLGSDAYNDGVSDMGNPYELGTEEYEDWERGWEEAAADEDDEGMDDD